MAERLPARITARLDSLAARQAELTARLADPGAGAGGKLAELHRELGRLERPVRIYEDYRRVVAELGEHQSLLEPGGDPELRELARSELPALEERMAALAEELVDELLAGEGDGDRNAIVEIRAGTGGDEAALFAKDLFEAYQRWFAREGWKVEVLSSAPTELGGYKDIAFLVSGPRVFHRLRFEAGGHRVQRVPATESQGRVHTSAATVAVLPEAEEVDVDVRTEDLRIDTYRASGAGGQHVNKTDSAVRITHLPSGVVVACQDERSQHKNKARAMKILRSRLLEMARNEAAAAEARDRKEQVGSGDRSQRVRTYNFPQDRLTDHRLGKNFPLAQVLEGRFEPVVDALVAADRQRRLEDL